MFYKLDLYTSWSLSEVSEGMGELNFFELLNLKECVFSRLLPQSIGGLKCLTKMNLCKCEILSECPESIG